jgi:hypothetical protein
VQRGWCYNRTSTSLAIMGSWMPRDIYGCWTKNWWCGGDMTWCHLSTFCITITNRPWTLNVGNVPSSQPKVQVIAETWDLGIGPTITWGEVHEAR